MLRNLIDEVRSRRVLAFAALGVLVALALPLLFLKSAPEGAPDANTAAPAAAEQAKLPERAARLLATSDAGAAGGRAKGSAQDPFSPPAAYRAAIESPTANGAAGPAPAGGGGSAPAAAGSVPASSAAAQKAANEQAGGGSKGLSSPVPAVSTSPAATTGTPSDRSTSSRKPARSLNAANAAVDIRYGPKRDTRIRRAIPRQKAFYIHGKLVAVFVKYSPTRKAAVFAVAPGLHVTGDVKCRVINGACRYVDLPAGAHAWLTMVTANRTIVSRRLDVVHIKRRTAGGRTRATSASSRSEAACLARKLVAMERGDALLSRNACKD